MNWHNLLTQEQAVVGDVFNLGPNESGKTTLLDGIHAALTLGEPHMEWNSAADPSAGEARLKREGRTLRDIVFRINQHGQSESASIVYFAVELTNRQTGEVYSVGLGAYAPTPQSDVVKWGFVIPQRLREIHLTNETGAIVHDQEALEEIYGPGAVLGVRRFRQRVADLFFGTLADYDGVLDLLKLGKSYNRLVQQTDNFSTLFRRALPPPDPADFDSARAQLDTIRSIRVAIDSLRAQKTTLERVQTNLLEVQRQKAALRRYELRSLTTRVEEEENAERRATGEIRRIDADLARLAEEDEANADRTRTQEGIARDLEKTGVDDLQRSTEAAQEEHDRAAGRLRDATRRHDDAAEEFRIRLAEDEKAWDAASAALAQASRAIGEQRRRLPHGASPGFAALFDDLREDLQLPTREDPRLPDAFDAHLDSLDEIVRQQREHLGRLVQAQEARLEQLDEASRRAQGEFEALAGRHDVPPLPSVEAAARGLDARVRVLYQHAEYDSSRERDAALLEAYLPPAVLAALLPVDVGDADRLKALVQARAPHVKVVDLAALHAGPLPPDSILRVLDAGRTHPDVLAYLATEYGDVRLRDPGARREAGERVVWRDGEVYDGHAWHLSEVRAEPRFVGAQARARTLAQRKAALEEEMGRLAAEAERARQERKRLDEESRLYQGVRDEIRASLNRHAAVASLARFQKIADALNGLRLVKEREEGAMKRERVEYEGRLRRLQALQEQARSTGAHETIAKLAAAREAITALRRAKTEIDTTRGGLQNARGGQEARLREATERLASLRPARQAKFDELARLLQFPAAEVEAYLRETGFYRIKETPERKRDEALTAIGNAQNEARNLLVELSAKRALRYDSDANEVHEAIGGRTLKQVIDHLERSLAEKDVENVEATRVLSEKIIVEGIAASIKDDALAMENLVDRVNRQLATVEFRGVTFHLKRTPVADPKIAQIRRLILEASAEASHETLADFIRVHLEVATGGSEVPNLFDYRRWYEFTIRSVAPEGQPDLDRIAKGSGGRQATPKYLFCFCLFSLLYDRIGSRLRLILIDEAFQRIDAGNIDQLIRFAKKRDLLLVVTNTDLDGATEAMSASTVNMFHKNDRDESFVLPWTKMSMGTYVRRE